SSDVAMTEPSMALTRGFLPLPTSISRRAARAPKASRMTARLTPRVAAKCASPGRLSPTRSFCVRIWSLTAWMACWTRDRPSVEAAPFIDVRPISGRQALGAEIGRRQAEPAAEGAGEAGVVEIAVLIAD